MSLQFKPRDRNNLKCASEKNKTLSLQRQESQTDEQTPTRTLNVLQASFPLLKAALFVSNNFESANHKSNRHKRNKSWRLLLLHFSLLLPFCFVLFNFCDRRFFGVQTLNFLSLSCLSSLIVSSRVEGNTRVFFKKNC